MFFCFLKQHQKDSVATSWRWVAWILDELQAEPGPEGRNSGDTPVVDILVGGTPAEVPAEVPAAASPVVAPVALPGSQGHFSAPM